MMSLENGNCGKKPEKHTSDLCNKLNKFSNNVGLMNCNNDIVNTK